MSSQVVLPKVGQIWREVDPRFKRFVKIHAVHGGTVSIWAVVRGLPSQGWIKAPRSRMTSADPSRFNGKRGGYALVEDI